MLSAMAMFKSVVHIPIKPIRILWICIGTSVLGVEIRLYPSMQRIIIISLHSVADFVINVKYGEAEKKHNFRKFPLKFPNEF